MAEAVIVAVARSPIGRAFKGSLRELRPDDLAATIVRAALDKVPQLEPADIDDLMLGCGLPGGEAGFNMARVVAVLLGYRPPARAPRSPGTARRRCRPPGWPCTRSRPARATCSSPRASRRSAGTPRAAATRWPDTVNPVFDGVPGPHREDGRRAALARWHDPREDGELPDVYIAMGQTAENVARLRGISRAEQDEFGVRSQNLAEQAIKSGFYAREITPVTLPDGTVVDRDDGPRPGVTLDAVAALKPVFRPDGTVTAGNCCPLNDGAAAVVVMSDRKARDLGITPLARIVVHRGLRAVAGDHGARPGRRPRGRRCTGPA